MASRLTLLTWSLLALSLIAGGCKSTPGSSAPDPSTAPPEAVEAEAPPRQDVAPPVEAARRGEGVSPVVPEVEQEPRYADVDWPHLRIDLNARVIEIEGVCAINSGWLEQIVCTVETRTHESLVATQAKPSHLHAALLLIGLEPGKPGWWKVDPDDPEGRKWIVQPPAGSHVSITFEWKDGEGVLRRAAAREWVRDFHTHNLLPEGPWIFGGSMMKPDYTGVMTYVADRTGSIAGLVTFGDELLGWCEVLPDQESVMAPEWEANTPAMPETGTRVVVRLRAME